MYDPVETDLSFNLLIDLSNECNKRSIPIAIIGGWATYFYVNPTYRRAFGKNYMGSRDIDVCFDHPKEQEFYQLIKDMGFTPNGMYFRWEKIYNRETKQYIEPEEAKKVQIFNLIHIFLDLFCDKETEVLRSWYIDQLKDRKIVHIDEFSVADIDTLINLKCVALFSRDKSDKENKDACDLYTLAVYSQYKITNSELLKRAIEKIVSRSDLLYVIAQHVLLDPAKQNIVQFLLNSKLRELNK